MPDAPGQPLPPYTPATPTAPAEVVAEYSPLSPVVIGQPTPGACFLTITGTLTTNGVTELTFDNLSNVLSENGRVKFSDPIDGDTAVFWGGDEDQNWYIEKSGVGAVFMSSEDVEQPHLVTTWVAIAPATGTPVVTMTGELPQNYEGPPNTIAEP